CSFRVCASTESIERRSPLPHRDQDGWRKAGSISEGRYLVVNDQVSLTPSAVRNSTEYCVFPLSALFAQKQIGLFLSSSSSSTGFLSESSRPHCGAFR